MAMSIKAAKAMFGEIAAFQFTQQQMQIFGNIAVEERKKGFERSESYDGERWTPLAESTIRAKRGMRRALKARKGQLYRSKQKRASLSPEKPLIDTGDLMKPIVKATSEQARVILAQSRSIGVSGGKSISEIHEQGTSKIPQRKHWGIYQKAVERILKARDMKFDRFLKQTIAKYDNAR